ncbi:CAP domain-containing protein [Clostridium thailandense]|uniref:CAP domain-containing protein n=1 Tax=Clostridium thailandense TaxID=2794346 RepID=UPI003988DA75
MKNKILVSTLLFLSIFTVSCAQKQQSPQQPIAGVASSYYKAGNVEKVKITTDQANIRTGCSNTNPVVQTSGKGSTFDVVSQVSDWFAVKLPNNQIGFVSSSQCKPIATENKSPQATPDTTGTSSPGATSQGSASVPAPGASTAPKTPASQTNSATLTDTEQQMLKLVNDARTQNGLTPLKVDMQLCNVARIKSQDMIDNNYFSHSSPKYGSPFDMMKSFGISFVQAGENIAGNQTVQNAENALMNSPGHRKNILSPDFTHIGIGIRSGGPYGNMFTQEFVSKPQ